MSDGGHIKVNYQTLHQAGDDCNATVSSLQQSFDRLKDDLKQLTTNWTGDARHAYDDAQRNWDQKFMDLKQVLSQVATALPQIAEHYKSTDGKAQGMFQ